MVEVRISVLFQDAFERGAVHRKGFIGRQSAEIDDAGDKEQLAVRHNLSPFGTQFGQFEGIEQYLEQPIHQHLLLGGGQ